MSYPIERVMSPKSSWHTPEEARDFYGRYSREGVTVHWWGGGEPASAHDNIVNYFLRTKNVAPIDKRGSVNYILSDNKITMMVEPDNVAWCSQTGNPTTISIEHQPTLAAEGYKKSGWLIYTLEKKFNRRLTLYPHKHWFNTACPGTLSLDRIRKEADNWHKGGDTLQPEDVDIAFQATTNRQAKPEEIKLHTGRQATQLNRELLNSEENKVLRTKAANFDAVAKALQDEYNEDDEKKLQEIKKIVEG